MASRLSSRAFAAVARAEPATVEELSLRLVRESDLPPDWLDTTIGCYSVEAEYYALAQYAHTAPLKATVNGFAADHLARAGARTIVDVGVGDGHRLALIAEEVRRRTGHDTQLFGVELSSEMAQLAAARGVTVVQQDMRLGVPDFGTELDGVLMLSGDLGFVMDPVDGPALRARLLASAHERLRPGGVVVLELVTRDPRPVPDGADVFHFSRAPRASTGSSSPVEGPRTWQFIKTFTRAEVGALVAASDFQPRRARMVPVVRASDDRARIGTLVETDELRADESYRLLVALVK